MVTGVTDCGNYDTDISVDGTYVTVDASGTVEFDIDDDIQEALQDVADYNDIDVSDIDIEYVDFSRWDETFTVNFSFEKESEPAEFEREFTLHDVQRSIQVEMAEGRLSVGVLQYLFGSDIANILRGE